MPVEVTIPQAGESIVEVQVGEWRKNVGDRVEIDETLVEIETDKAAMELPAPAAGILQEIRLATGAAAVIGDVVAVIAESAGDRAPATRKPPPVSPAGAGRGAARHAGCETRAGARGRACGGSRSNRPGRARAQGKTLRAQSRSARAPPPSPPALACFPASRSGFASRLGSCAAARRRSRRAGCLHDAFAQSGRAQPGAGAAKRRPAHDVQRSGHVGGDRVARQA